MKYILEVDIPDGEFCSGCLFEIDLKVCSKCICPGIEGDLQDYKHAEGYWSPKRSLKCIEKFGILNHENTM